ncbi:MAG: hypothetical protein ACYDH9_24690 [Limisphaerales bacterium]
MAKTISRCKSLSQSAVFVDAGITLSSFIPGRVLASPGRLGANDCIGIGHIGIGGMGSGQLQGCRTTLAAGRSHRETPAITFATA